MFRILITFGLFFALAIVAENTESTRMKFGPPLPPYFKLERHSMQEIRRGEVVGTAIALVEDGRISYVRAFGTQKKHVPIPVNVDTVFQLGSMSKTLTASLFARAKKQGLLDLETPIDLPGCRFPRVLSRHILNHTSGFKRIGWNWQIENGASREKLLTLFPKKEQHVPGVVFDYHNVAFSLIEIPIEKAYGLPFSKAVEAYLFKPLAMSRATVGITTFKQQPNRAWPHERNQKGIIVASDDYSFRYHDTVPSSGGMNASINDMAQFLLLQMGYASHVATAEDLALFHEPNIEASDAKPWFKKHITDDYSCHYGLGFRVLKRRDDTIVFHGGWLKGFTSILAFSKKSNKGIVVLSNTESGFALATAVQFLEGLFN